MRPPGILKNNKDRKKLVLMKWLLKNLKLIQKDFVSYLKLCNMMSTLPTTQKTKKKIKAKGHHQSVYWVSQPFFIKSLFWPSKAMMNGKDCGKSALESLCFSTAREVISLKMQLMKPKTLKCQNHKWICICTIYWNSTFSFSRLYICFGRTYFTLLKQVLIGALAGCVTST